MNKNENLKSILLEAQSIIFERAEEKQRDYGPIDESMQKAASIASTITGKETTATDMYKYIIALKLSRLSHSYKRDTYVDLVGYLAALANYEEKEHLQLKTI